METRCGRTGMGSVDCEFVKQRKRRGGGGAWNRDFATHRAEAGLVTFSFTLLADVYYRYVMPVHT
jgi:hypothetical protein